MPRKAHSQKKQHQRRKLWDGNTRTCETEEISSNQGNSEMVRKYFGKSANMVNLKMQDMSIFSDDIIEGDDQVTPNIKTRNK